MKRMLTALLLLAVFVSAIPAYAAPYSPGGPYLKTEILKFATHKATAATGEILVNDQLNLTTSCVACRVDSNEFNRLGATGATIAAAQAETTTAINTSRWSSAAAGMSADSAFYGRVVFSDGGVNGTGDSVLCTPQVSADGLNWNYVSGAKGVLGTNPILATVPTDAALVLVEQGGSGGAYSFKMLGTSLTGDLPDRLGIWQWPWVRFIIINDHAASIVNLNCHVIHWAID